MKNSHGSSFGPEMSGSMAALIAQRRASGIVAVDLAVVDARQPVFYSVSRRA
jgi:hypothetical protein